MRTFSKKETLGHATKPFSLDRETIGSYGVSSDSFSFYDSNHEELSASGNGGTRQMYIIQE